MLKTLTAIGISAAIVFAPLAAIAQTDTTAPAAGAAPAASDAMAPAKDSMKANKHKATEAHGQENEEAGTEAPADAPPKSQVAKSADEADLRGMNRPIPRMGRFFVSTARSLSPRLARMANSRSL